MEPRPPGYPPLEYCQWLADRFALQQEKQRGGKAANRQHRALLLRTLDAYKQSLEHALSLVGAELPAERDSLRLRVARCEQRIQAIYTREVDVTWRTPLFEGAEPPGAVEASAASEPQTERSRSPVDRRPPSPPPARPKHSQEVRVTSEVRILPGPGVRRLPPPPPLPRRSGPRPSSAPVPVPASPSPQPVVSSPDPCPDEFVSRRRAVQAAWPTRTSSRTHFLCQRPRRGPHCRRHRKHVRQQGRWPDLLIHRAASRHARRCTFSGQNGRPRRRFGRASASRWTPLSL